MNRGKAKAQILGLRPRGSNPILLLEHGVISGRRFRVAGLFAGVGGLELGLGRAGHETMMLCEIDPPARAVLETRFPSLPLEDDVRKVEKIPSNVDLLVGGFPCQDLSQAGKTAGIEGANSGLVGEVFRLLETRPVPWVLLENVPFMLRLAKGRALDVIVSRFERLGYRWAYRVVDTRAFGLPQRRERVFILASLEGDPRGVLLADDAGEPAPTAWNPRTMALGFYWTEGIRGLGTGIDCVPTLKGGSTIGIPSAPAILLPSGRVVTPDIRDAERLQGFPADWTLPAESVARPSIRWKLVGNAVTVDVARWIGLRLASPGDYDGSWDAPLVPGAPWPAAAWNMGEGRRAASVSAFPAQVENPGLARFLRYPPKDLSAKATAGFLARTRKSSLQFPPGFLEAVAEHLERMQGTAMTA